MPQKNNTESKESDASENKPIAACPFFPNTDFCDALSTLASVRITVTITDSLMCRACT